MISVQVTCRNLLDAYRMVYLLETNKCIYKHVEPTRAILAVLGHYKVRYNGGAMCTCYPKTAKINNLAEEISLMSIYDITSTYWELFYD